MRKLGLLVLTLMVSGPAMAQDAATSRTGLGDSINAQRLSDLGMKLNPQLGVSSFDYSRNSGGDARTRLSGGLTVEFGGPMRKLETGLLLLQSGSSALLKTGEEAQINSSYLSIPMVAKLRVLQMRAQSWYGKFGFMPAFEVASSRDSLTNNMDVFTTLGLGGRFYFNPKTDIVVEATYNRGMIDSLKQAGMSYNNGFMVMAGMSFDL